MTDVPVTDRPDEAPVTDAEARCPVPHGTSAPAPSSDAAVVADGGPHDQLPSAEPSLTMLGAPTADGCPVPHGAGTDAPAPAPEAPATCPFPHGQAAAEPDPMAGCPVAHGPKINPNRSKADLFVRKLLRIKERPAGVTSASAYSAFQRSMLISAIRCTLTYVVFPFVAPAIGFATGVGPVIGVLIGSVAMTCDVFTIRRFFAVDHKWRWYFSTIAFSIICLLAVLWVQDVAHIISHL